MAKKKRTTDLSTPRRSARLLSRRKDAQNAQNTQNTQKSPSPGVGDGSSRNAKQSPEQVQARLLVHRSAPASAFDDALYKRQAEMVLRGFEATRKIQVSAIGIDLDTESFESEEPLSGRQPDPDAYRMEDTEDDDDEGSFGGIERIEQALQADERSRATAQAENAPAKASKSQTEPDGPSPEPSPALLLQEIFAQGSQQDAQARPKAPSPASSQYSSTPYVLPAFDSWPLPETILEDALEDAKVPNEPSDHQGLHIPSSLPEADEDMYTSDLGIPLILPGDLTSLEFLSSDSVRRLSPEAEPQINRDPDPALLNSPAHQILRDVHATPIPEVSFAYANSPTPFKSPTQRSRKLMSQMQESQRQASQRSKKNLTQMSQGQASENPEKRLSQRSQEQGSRESQRQSSQGSQKQQLTSLRRSPYSSSQMKSVKAQESQHSRTFRYNVPPPLEISLSPLSPKRCSTSQQQHSHESTTETPDRARFPLPEFDPFPAPPLTEIVPKPHEILSPPPQTNSNPPLITPFLETLAAKPHTWQPYYKPSQTRELREMERGCWVINTGSWCEKTKLEFWRHLKRNVEAGSGNVLGNFGVWQRKGLRRKSADRVKVYCWGKAAELMWAFLFVISNRRTKTGAHWIDAGGNIVINCP
ncbi:hypothetical protein BDZ91DRAFT_766221 [Kalaharituber pfeilii]|nr:hypothetical protein BDZ91DRAFT_766221 [Kalaharituber pfeilii]